MGIVEVAGVLKALADPAERRLESNAVGREPRFAEIGGILSLSRGDFGGTAGGVPELSLFRIAGRDSGMPGLNVVWGKRGRIVVSSSGKRTDEARLIDFALFGGSASADGWSCVTF